MSAGKSAEDVNWSVVIHGLTSAASKISADVSFVFWRWEPCDSKISGGFARLPSFFYPTKPFSIDLSLLIRPGLSLADLSIREVEDSLIYLFSRPISEIPRFPKLALEKLPPSQRQKAKERMAETENLLKTWRKTDARSRS